MPGMRPHCCKGRHYANQCRSRFDKDGNPINQQQRNWRRSTGQGRTKTQMPLNVLNQPQSLENNSQGVWINSQPKLGEVPEWMF